MSGNEIKRRLIPAAQWSGALLPFLEEGHILKLCLEGSSMVPLLVGGRDEVLLRDISEKKLRRGDIVLYVRQNGTHVLHRIHHVDTDTYYLLGDAQTWVEGPINKANILAVAIAVIRNGETIACGAVGYRLITHLWLMLRPVRPWILRMLDRVPLLRKILLIILRPIRQ